MQTIYKTTTEKTNGQSVVYRTQLQKWLLETAALTFNTTALLLPRKHCNKIFLCNNHKHIQNFSRNIKPKATEARLRAVVLEEMQTDYFAFANTKLHNTPQRLFKYVQFNPWTSSGMCVCVSLCENIVSLTLYRCIDSTIRLCDVGFGCGWSIYRQNRLIALQRIVKA